MMRPLAVIPLLLSAATACAGPWRTLDDFASSSAWKPVHSDYASLSVSAESAALRLDLDFGGRAGFVLAERRLDLPLPPNYEFRFRVRGDISPNNLEFKLMDESGENVWWKSQPRFVFSPEWKTVTLKARHIGFAWGPAGGGTLSKAGTMQFGIAAAEGGKGTVWFDRFEFRELPPLAVGRPMMSVTASSNPADAANVLDGDPDTVWTPHAGDDGTLTLDLGGYHAVGGLSVTWPNARVARSFRILSTTDGETWEAAREASPAQVLRTYIQTPDLEASALRLEFSGVDGVADVSVKEAAFGESLNGLLAEVAADGERGMWPRYLTGDASYWTVTGTPTGTREALMNTDGMVETGQGRPSIEPSLRVGSHLYSWADIKPSPALADDNLPLPRVTWTVPGLRLQVAPFIDDVPGEPLFVRYSLTNTGKEPVEGDLFLAVRPLQTNPPWQFLNMVGGFAPMGAVAWDGARLSVEGGPVITPIAAPADTGIASFVQGGWPDPMVSIIADGYASATLRFPFDLKPGESKTISLRVDQATAPAVAVTESDVDALQTKALASWRKAVGPLRLTLPPPARIYGDALRANVGYALVNRDGPRIQPGARSYARSWIRDGALTSAALMSVGLMEPARSFLEWFAPYQFENGAIPCVVDARGADPTAEHDSHGEFIFLVAEYVRFTNDLETARAMYPRVVKAARHIQDLRATRMTDAYRNGPLEERVKYGLLPESISHEGYSAKPMHSYWDDFFALRGLKDAAYLAARLGRPDEAAEYTRQADAFRTDLLASLNLAIATKKIDYLPGCAELGDFDATSTSIAVNVLGEAGRLPQAPLEGTYDRYVQFVRDRSANRIEWDAYTPYEIRNCTALLLLGRKKQAHAAMEFFFKDMRPREWRQWGEIVYKDPKAGKWIGDMPHSWVGSEYIRFARTIFAHEREEDNSLVLGLGVLEGWLNEGRVSVERMPTWYGPLSYSMRKAGNAIFVTIGAGVKPPRGIVVCNPGQRPIKRATVNGKPVTVRGNEVVLRGAPAVLALEY
jgi:hypothetical protein